MNVEKGAIKNGQSRKTGNTGCNRHSTKTNKAKYPPLYVIPPYH